MITPKEAIKKLEDVGFKIKSGALLKEEYIFLVESDSFDPYIAFNRNTGKVRSYTPAEDVEAYGNAFKNNKIM